jgi:peptide/nickel transport system permease protein
VLSLVFKRLLAAVPVVLIVATVVFLLLRMAPGDPARVIAGDMASEDTIAQIRTNLGLDRPLPTQYAMAMSALAKGDLGTSIVSKQPVSALIGSRIGPTAALAVSSLLLTVLLAIPLGVLSAWWHRRAFDRATMALTVLAFSVPAFVVGYVLILVFSVTLNWFPVQGYAPLADGVGGFVYRLVLPSLTLATVFVALITRITRASMLDVLGEDFVRTARAKGVHESRVVFKHTLRNALIPVVTMMGLQFGFLLGGSILVEAVFNWPGLGRLLVDAVQMRDYPVIQTLVLLFSLEFILINLLVDVLYAVINPTIRFQ